MFSGAVPAAWAAKLKTRVCQALATVVVASVSTDCEPSAAFSTFSRTGTPAAGDQTRADSRVSVALKGSRAIASFGQTATVVPAQSSALALLTMRATLFAPSAGSATMLASFTRHVVHRETGQRGRNTEHAIKEGNRFGQGWMRLLGQLLLALQAVQRMPVIERQALANMGRRPHQMADIAGQATRLVGVVNGLKQNVLAALADFGILFRFGQNTETQRQIQRRSDSRGLFATGFNHPAQGNAQHAGAVVETLGITAEPEQVFNDARR